MRVPGCVAKSAVKQWVSLKQADHWKKTMANGQGKIAQSLPNLANEAIKHYKTRVHLKRIDAHVEDT